MKNRKWLVFSTALLLMAGTVGVLSWLKSHQRLGRPGIKAVPIPDSVVMKIDLPERVPGFTSTNIPEPEVVLGYLPKDTSYTQRIYTAPDGLEISGVIILMGADRTSIHKPEYCLPGQGWTINEKTVTNISIAGFGGRQMPVAKWIAGNSFKTADGKKQEVNGVFVFWFVADNQQTTDNYQRMWWLGRDLLKTGVLQRWAYIAYFAVCRPGNEEATFGRMKELIAASVPEFQLAPRVEKIPASAVAEK